MTRKRHSAEEIVNKLWQAELELSKGSSVEVFETLLEARVPIERWRQHYNTV